MSGGHDGFAHTRAAGLHISSLIHRCLAFSDALAALAFPMKLVHRESQTLVFPVKYHAPLAVRCHMHQSTQLTSPVVTWLKSPSQKSHSESEYQITSLPLFLDVIKWVTIHSNAEIPFRS